MRGGYGADAGSIFGRSTFTDDALLSEVQFVAVPLTRLRKAGGMRAPAAHGLVAVVLMAPGFEVVLGTAHSRDDLHALLSAWPEALARQVVPSGRKRLARVVAG